jgi:hypothetical protein
LPDVTSTHRAFGFKLPQLHVNRVTRYVEVRAQLDDSERLSLQQAQNFVLGGHEKCPRLLKEQIIPTI